MSTPAIQLQSERAKYPAMQVDEILVWRMWLLTHQSLYDGFDYNVAIGISQDPGPAYTDAIRKMAIFIRSKRLDAVAYSGPQPVIFEVKRRAGPENVGQLVIYQHWWPLTFPGGVAPRMVLVATDADPHILPVLAKLGIEYDQVPGVDFSVLAPGRIIPPADQSVSF